MAGMIMGMMAGTISLAAMAESGSRVAGDNHGSSPVIDAGRCYRCATR